MLSQNFYYYNIATAHLSVLFIETEPTFLYSIEKKQEKHSCLAIKQQLLEVFEASNGYNNNDRIYTYIRRSLQHIFIFILVAKSFTICVI